MTQPTYLDWHHCYNGGWKNEIVPDAFQHPAKYSRRLIARIYDHLLAEGLIERGARVVDPFGGVALGALDAMRCGLDWTGVELEPKFHALGNANIALWNARYSSLPRWGTARLLNGDSRNLAQIVREANAAISSPPYAEAITYQQAGAGGEGNELMRAGFTVQEIAEMRRNNDPRILETRRNAGYSRDMNNLGNLREGDFAAAVSSPPYAEGLGHGGISATEIDKKKFAYAKANGTTGNYAYGDSAGNLARLREGDFAAAVSSPPYEEARIGESSGAANVGHGENYGTSAGQLGSMSGGDFDAAVSSPPYEKSLDHGMAATSIIRHAIAGANGITNTEFVTPIDALRNGADSPTYGATAGNIGNDSGETFWLASRQIVSQVYSVLAPRGVAVWVVKDFVRNKARVPFCAQWRELCEHLGFEHLYTARAWLVENNGTQLAHDGNHKQHVKERKSFFRRLNEKNGGPRIDWEEIIFMVKP